MRTRRRRALRDQLAVAGEPGQPMRIGKARQRGRALRRQRARAAHIDVEPCSVAVTWMSSGFFSAPSASASAQAAGIAPSSAGASTGQRSIETMWCAR